MILHSNPITPHEPALKFDKIPCCLHQNPEKKSHETSTPESHDLITEFPQLLCHGFAQDVLATGRRLAQLHEGRAQRLTALIKCQKAMGFLDVSWEPKGRNQ